MREVYIGKSVKDGDGKELSVDYEPIDVNESSNVNYEFTSPIFEDISSIKCNRTSTYKVPATARNLRVFDIVNQSDVQSDIPHRNMLFREYKDGLPIIGNGQCRILEADSKDISLAVAWGNKVNIQKLSEIKLNQLDFPEYVEKGNQAADAVNYLLSTDDTPYGYLYMDFGQGFNNKYADPCVRADFVLDKLGDKLGLEFDKPDFLTQYWMPLTFSKDKQLDKHTSCRYNIASFGQFNFTLAPDGDPKQISELRSNGKSFSVHGGKKSMQVNMTMNIIESYAGIDPNPAQIEIVKINSSGASTIKEISIPYSVKYEENQDPRIEYWFMDGGVLSETIHCEEGDTIIISGSLNSDPSRSGECFVEVVLDDVIDYIKLAPLMPDMSGSDYLKSILNMFGLFAFYDKERENLVRMISIDNIYDKIKNGEAKDWSNKRLSGTFNLTRTFKDYARINWFKYGTDDTVNVDANGSVQVDAEFLDAEKNLVELKFMASEMVDGIVKMDRYQTKNGSVSEPNTIKVRIVREDILEIPQKSYKCGKFDETMYFSGESGLLATYYKTYQKVIRRPVVMEVAVYLSAIDLHNLSEIDVIYLDGNYYMPISIQCDSNGNAKCKLLMLPEAHTI